MLNIKYAQLAVRSAVLLVPNLTYFKLFVAAITQ